MEWPLWVNLIRDKNGRAAGVHTEIYLESLTAGPLLRLEGTTARSGSNWEGDGNDNGTADQVTCDKLFDQQCRKRGLVPSDNTVAKTAPQGNAVQTAFQASSLSHKWLFPAGPQRIAEAKVMLRNKCPSQPPSRVLRSTVLMRSSSVRPTKFPQAGMTSK